jgi:unsaturated rhamnogalacturonyl hydrolase
MQASKSFCSQWNSIHFIFVSIVMISYLLPNPLAAQDIQETTQKIRTITGGVIKDATFQFINSRTGKHYKSAVVVSQNVDLKTESLYNDWRYWNGVLNIAMLKLGDALNEPLFSEFAIKNVAFGFDNFHHFEKTYKGEDKWSYPFGQFFKMEELDDCGAMGASVIEVNCIEHQERYMKYIDRVAAHIITRQSRLEDGTFVRNFPQKWTLWADDLYMGLTFLSRMGELTGNIRYFDDAARQVINFHKYLFDEAARIMHHCWYSESRRQGAAFWGRANGWAIIAQIDLLERLPENHPQRDTLRALFVKHISGIAQYQESNGLWHQLLDKKDSYLETSCSAMFTYAFARAVNKGYIDPHLASIAQRGWEGVMTKIRNDGKVEGICVGTVINDDLNYYYQRPTPLNDIHGVATVLLAGSEMLQLSKKATCKKCH